MELIASTAVRGIIILRPTSWQQEAFTKNSVSYNTDARAACANRHDIPCGGVGATPPQKQTEHTPHKSTTLVSTMSFTLVHHQESDFAKGVMYHYRHDRTGCEVIHMHNDDAENAFVFSVPTQPSDSSGVAHILEHTVLCGSQKHQTKAPFHHLFEGSCKTYLNALTYPDRTLYPGASTIKQDLFNLLDVYADAVWFPLLRESFFRQEGFHFINTAQKDAQATPQTAGVVFNEMKGAYSEREELISNAMHHALFPHNLYNLDSGGDPRDIPLLSYQAFVAFHKQWYRPEYTKILLYGNIETQEYLDRLETQHLSRWSEKPQAAYSPITLHKPVRTEPELRVAVPQLAGEENKHSVDIAWALPFSTTATQQRMTMAFLHSVLMAIPGSPLRKALLDSGLGEDISHLSGYEGSLYQVVYDIGLTGVASQSVPKVAPFIHTQLQSIIEDGFDTQLIEAALHRTEFYYKESLTNTERKIRWLTSLARTWLYGGDVYADTQPLNAINLLKEQLHKPTYLSTFARSALLQNTHKVVAIAQPDKGYNKTQQDQEQQRIQTQWNKQEAKQKQYWHDIEQQITAQEQQQDSPEAIASIPRLHVGDLPRKVEVWDEEQVLPQLLPHGVQWLAHEDNDIVYLWLHFDVTDLAQAHQTQGGTQGMLLQTLASTFTDLGTTTCPYDALAVRIRKISGVFHAYINPMASATGEAKVFVSIGVHAMSKHIAESSALILQLCTSIAYENTQRLTQILHEEHSTIKARMMYYGTQFAMLKAAARYSTLAEVDDNHNAHKAIQHLARYIETPSALSTLTSSLPHLARMVYAKNRLRCTVVASPKHKAAVEQALTPLIQQLPHDESYNKGTLPNAINRATQGLVRKAFYIPSQVSYNACVLPSVSYTDETYVAHAMVGRMASSTLWESIRMKYGAYGAGCSVDGAEQLMEFYTYRDPNIETSYHAFFDALKKIEQGAGSQDELEKLTIGMVGEALKPASPSRKGMVAYERMICGITTQLRQDIRERTLSLTRKQVTSAAAQALARQNQASFASFCSKDAAQAQTWHWDSTEDTAT